LVALAQEAGGHALGGFAMMLTMVATAAWVIAWFRLSALQRRSIVLAVSFQRLCMK